MPPIDSDDLNADQVITNTEEKNNTDWKKWRGRADGLLEIFIRERGVLDKIGGPFGRLLAFGLNTLFEFGRVTGLTDFLKTQISDIFDKLGKAAELSPEKIADLKSIADSTFDKAREALSKEKNPDDENKDLDPSDPKQVNAFAKKNPEKFKEIFAQAGTEATFEHHLQKGLEKAGFGAGNLPTKKDEKKIELIIKQSAVKSGFAKDVVDELSSDANSGELLGKLSQFNAYDPYCLSTATVAALIEKVAQETGYTIPDAEALAKVIVDKASHKQPKDSAALEKTITDSILAFRDEGSSSSEISNDKSPPTEDDKKFALALSLNIIEANQKIPFQMICADQASESLSAENKKQIDAGKPSLYTFPDPKSRFEYYVQKGIAEAKAANASFVLNDQSIRPILKQAATNAGLPSSLASKEHCIAFATAVSNGSNEEEDLEALKKIYSTQSNTIFDEEVKSSSSHNIFFAAAKGLGLDDEAKQQIGVAEISSPLTP